MISLAKLSKVQAALDSMKPLNHDALIEEASIAARAIKLSQIEPIVVAILHGESAGLLSAAAKGIVQRETVAQVAAIAQEACVGLRRFESTSEASRQVYLECFTEILTPTIRKQVAAIAKQILVVEVEQAHTVSYNPHLMKECIQSIFARHDEAKLELLYCSQWKQGFDSGVEVNHGDVLDVETFLQESDACSLMEIPDLTEYPEYETEDLITMCKNAFLDGIAAAIECEKRLDVF